CDEGSVVSECSTKSDNRVSRQEKGDEQEHDSSAHDDDQRERVRRRDDDADAAREQQSQSKDASEDTRSPPARGDRFLKAPPLGGPRRYRLHAPSFDRAYLMAPPPARSCTSVLYGPSNGPAVHGRDARSRLDPRCEGRPGRPPRARGAHQEPHEGRGAIRTAAREEPRDAVREGLDSDAGLVRGWDDPAWR